MKTIGFSKTYTNMNVYAILIFGKSQIVNMLSAKINNNTYKCLDFG